MVQAEGKQRGEEVGSWYRKGSDSSQGLPSASVEGRGSSELRCRTGEQKPGGTLRRVTQHSLGGS